MRNLYFKFLMVLSVILVVAVVVKIIVVDSKDTCVKPNFDIEACNGLKVGAIGHNEKSK